MKAKVKYKGKKYTVELTDKQISLVRFSDLFNARPTATPETGRYIPKMGEKYWTYFFLGPIQYTNDNNPKDNHHISIGHSYKTKQEARDAHFTEKKKHEILDFIAKENNGWWPDWNDVSQAKHYICKHGDGCGFCYGSHFKNQTQPDSHYFKPGLFDKIQAQFGADMIHLFK